MNGPGAQGLTGLEDGLINEGGHTQLVCTATGVPTPTVQWRREDGKEIMLRSADGRDKQGNYAAHVCVGLVIVEWMGRTPDKNEPYYKIAKKQKSDKLGWEMCVCGWLIVIRGSFALCEVEIFSCFSALLVSLCVTWAGLGWLCRVRVTNRWQRQGARREHMKTHVEWRTVGLHATKPRTRAPCRYMYVCRIYFSLLVSFSLSLVFMKCNSCQGCGRRTSHPAARTAH